MSEDDTARRRAGSERAALDAYAYRNQPPSTWTSSYCCLTIIALSIAFCSAVITFLVANHMYTGLPCHDHPQSFSLENEELLWNGYDRIMVASKVSNWPGIEYTSLIIFIAFPIMFISNTLHEKAEIITAVNEFVFCCYYGGVVHAVAVVDVINDVAPAPLLDDNDSLAISIIVIIITFAIAVLMGMN
uniref:Aa_trans domain-containing protein n=1 Tax=Angiostrongylus cantonensis TaxID=6313 RepID=A0A0K0DNH0_ANGCA